MNYLAKLKQIESNENFDNTPSIELTKPTKPPFVSFVSTNTEDVEKNISNSSDQKREERRLKVLAMLEDSPSIQRAFVTDTEVDSDNLILTMAIRDVASFEMLIPLEKYDAFLLLELLEKVQIQ